MDAADLPPLLAALVSAWSELVLGHPWFIVLLYTVVLCWLINRA